MHWARIQKVARALRRGPIWDLWGLRPLVFSTYRVPLHRVAGKQGCELLPIVWAWYMTVYPSAAHNMKTCRKKDL